MTKIAYVTDLHITHETKCRATALVTKMANVKGRAGAFFFGGDTFTLGEQRHWDALMNGPAGNAVIEMTNYSGGLTKELLPSIIEAAGGLPIFMLQGNADAISFFHIQKKLAEYSGVKPVAEDVLEFMSFYIIGLGGIEANDPGALKVNESNSWYMGVLSGKDFKNGLDRIDKPTREWTSNDWRRTIFMTHLPAYGYVDVFGDKHNGNCLVEQFIRRNHPLLHLTGHVHDAAADIEKDQQTGQVIRTYSPGKTRKVIDEKTLTVNPGGGVLHDAEIRMVLIDVDKLISGQGDPLSAVEHI